MPPGTAGTPTAWAPPQVWPVTPEGGWQPGDAVPWSAQSGSIRAAVNPQGDQVVILDGAAQHWVTDAGPNPLQLNTPVAAAVGPNGWVYVANLGNHDVLAFLPNGRLIAAFGGYGTGPGQLISPAGIAVAPGGTVFVADAGRQQVVAFSPTGRTLRAWGSWGSQPGQFAGPPAPWLPGLRARCTSQTR